MPKDAEITRDDIYVRTADGDAALADDKRALSSGFREMLKVLDGKLTVAQVEKKFPRLDEEDVMLWLGELLRMRLIDIADVPFELPAIKPHARTGAPVAPASSGDAFDVAAMAANVEEWLKQDTDAYANLGQAQLNDLNKTIHGAALQSTQALSTLQDSGFFANLVNPHSLVGRQPRRPEPPKVKSERKGLVLVYETDVNDIAQLSVLLNSAGYQAQLCNTKAQLVLLLNQPLVPEVIFLKHGGMEVDVFKVLDRLRTHPRLGKAAVVLMADKPSREDIAKSILLGASGWMTKPYSAEVMAAAIQGVLTFPPASVSA